MSKVLHIHVSYIQSVTDSTVVQPNLQIVVGIDDDDDISAELSPSINLKTLGVYKTAIQMNAAIVSAVKDYLYNTYSIPTNGYGAEYLSGAYGLLSIL